jgi:predicted Zn-dependent peptidase
MRYPWAFAALLAAAPPQDDGRIRIDLQVDEFVLDNGMRILTVENPGAPRVFCALYWRVGSVNERPGITGLSHFFEHMMFKGTATIGTQDAARDAGINAAIEGLMTRHRAFKMQKLEMARRGLELPAEAQAAMDKIWAEYEALVAEQKKITISEHLWKTYMSNGGTRLNASTSSDRTNYYVELPSNKIELFFWLESDRFSRPVFREFYPEREVVKEERRLRTDSTPTGLINEAFGAMFWQSHPYRWPVIGWMSDIDQYTLRDAEAYFQEHYSPQNCTAIFAGDVDPARVRELALRYFGRLKRFGKDPDPIVTVEPEQTAPKRMTAEADTQPSIQIRWHAPAAVHADAAGLDLLASILSGRTGRLHKRLVNEKKIALQAGSGYGARRYGGQFTISASPRLRPGEDADARFAEVEAEIDAVLEEIRREGVTELELRKVKNQALADLVRGIESNNGIVNQLGHYEVVGTYRDFFAGIEALEAATADHLKGLAERYLSPKGKNVLVVKRKEAK